MPSLLQNWDPVRNQEDREDTEIVNEKDNMTESALEGDWPQTDTMVHRGGKSANVQDLVKKAVRNMGETQAESANDENEEVKFAWPTRSKQAASEFDAGFYPKAFPHLFPDGKADYHDSHPGGTPRFPEYVRHLLDHHDGRFAKDPLFL
jgi:hypothetical protein